MKKTGIFAMITAGVMLVTAGCGKTKAGAAAVTVGNVSVTMNDISLFLTKGDGFDASKKQYVELMSQTLKYGELAKAEGVELTQEDIDGITQSKAQRAQQAGGLSAYKEYLAKVGSSMDFLTTLFTASAYQSKLQEQYSAEIKEPEEGEIVDYMENNYLRAKHILISKEDANATDGEAAADATPGPATEDEQGRKGEDLAKALLDRAKGGENFDELIAKYNSDPGMASNPDGYVFTDGTMMKEFEDCVKSLQPGEFGICETSYGYHVIQRLSLDDKDENFNKWLEDNRQSVISDITDKKLDELLNKKCDEKGIKYSINQSAVDAFTEDMIVEAPTAQK